MFNTHNINNNTISIRNLILLFLTIVFGFASVITLAQITIMSDISNARQTISKISITADGTDSAQLEMEVSSEGIYINPDILDVQTTFSGKVLGIDENGDLIYVYSEDLIVSGVNIGEDGAWTIAGNDIYRYTGNVGIGTTTPTNKLHIVNSGSTDVYIEEQASGMAANLNLKSIARTRAVGGDSSPDIFYIGEAGGTIDFAVTPAGNVGIGTTTPTTKLQVDSYAQIGKDTSCTETTNTSGGTFLRLVGQSPQFSCWEGYIKETPNIQLNYGSSNRQIDNDNQLKFKYATGAEYTTKVAINSAGLLGAVDVQISNLTSKAVIGTNAAGKIIEATSGSIYNLISGFDLGGGMDDGSETGVTPYRNGSEWIVNSTNIFNNGGNVGIGTSTPQQKLEVNGNIRFTTAGYIEAGENLRQLYLTTGGNVGIGRIPTALFHVGGSAIIDNNITATAYYYSSDKKLKKNITPIKNALDKILALNGYFFTWKKTDKKDIGVIAQEVETIFPELVQTNDQGYKSVEYGNLVAPLIEAIKELNDKVDKQEEKIRKLENRGIDY